MSARCWRVTAYALFVAAFVCFWNTGGTWGPFWYISEDQGHLLGWTAFIMGLIIAWRARIWSSPL